jgi:hypothetical protein
MEADLLAYEFALGLITCGLLCLMLGLLFDLED